RRHGLGLCRAFACSKSTQSAAPLRGEEAGGGERPSSRSIRPVIWILWSVFLGYLSESLL
ncbi:MAG: hypothetical protein ACOVLE_05960, partial [Pirellula staleyi]